MFSVAFSVEGCSASRLECVLFVLVVLEWNSGSHVCVCVSKKDLCYVCKLPRVYIFFLLRKTEADALESFIILLKKRRIQLVVQLVLLLNYFF